MPAKKRLARMIGGSLGGATQSRCPPGVLCMETSVILLIVALVLFAGAVLYYLYSQHQSPAAAQIRPTVVVVEKSVPTTVQMPQQQQQQQQQADPRFAPLSPEQSYSTPPDLRGFPTAPMAAGMGAIPINQMTRPPSYPDQYQQIGVLTAPGGSETSASPTRTILPLFGRKLATNRDRWNYYTRTDGINPVQVPVNYKKRSCDDDTGCDEIMSGDSVSVPILGQSYVANMYRYSTPRYIPY